MVPAMIAGPIPPASIGLGIHAASPTRMYPFATRQSFCLQKEACQVPHEFPSSDFSSVIFRFFKTGLERTYSSISDFRSFFVPFLLLRDSNAFCCTPNPMFALFSPLGKTHAYPPGAVS